MDEDKQAIAFRDIGTLFIIIYCYYSICFYYYFRLFIYVYILLCNKKDK